MATNELAMPHQLDAGGIACRDRREVALLEIAVSQNDSASRQADYRLGGFKISKQMDLAPLLASTSFSILMESG